MPRKPGEQFMKQRERQTNKIYNKSRPERDKLYYSKQWKKISKLYRQSHPLCEECERNGRITPAYLVDHIVPIEDGGSMWEWDNLQSLCIVCHNRKHGDRQGGSKFL